jgi:hypothetical protein
MITHQISNNSKILSLTKESPINASNFALKRNTNFANIHADNQSEMSEEDVDTFNTPERQLVRVPTLDSPDLNECVDAILSKKPSHLDMVKKLALIHGISKRHLTNG